MNSDVTDEDIRHLKGIGPRRAELFARIGIRTVRDAFYYLPFRYEDRTRIKNICDVRPGSLETFRGKIISAAVKGPPRGMRIFCMAVNDGTGIVQAQWFNQPYMKKNFRIGQEVILSGQARMEPRFRQGLTVDSPEYELVAEGPDSFIHSGRIVPVYRLTEGIGGKQFRKIMFGIIEERLKDLEDPLPPGIIRRNGLPPLREAIRNLHFPDEGSQAELLNSGESVFHRRLAFDELFMLELGMAALRRQKGMERGSPLNGDGSLRKRLLQSLPFGLTTAQERVLEDILRDMRRPQPMQRLIQGDVGCGKTVVALCAMLNAVECGYQAALMAPTEILAVQHYLGIRQMVENLGVECALLSGSVKERRLDEISSGKALIVVGTHAMIQEGVSFGKLGLAVIDEQHKFGVVQRSLLRKKGLSPHVIVMTATPIPRSLALTLYGDLDCSVIDELPPGRKPVATRVIDEGDRAAIYRLMEDEIGKGRQVYVVYPVIEDSEKSDLRSAVRGLEGFRRIFPHFRVGLVHGRMETGERNAVMDSFRRGEIDIFVATSVIEVGVDVPNATIMIIIHAERFGLAQLHQLRGRVGRGAESSSCLLVSYGQAAEDARRRLDAMTASCDGFRIAEEDLAIRGSGEFFGTRQSGLPDLKIADIIRDRRILEAAKREAFDLMESGGAEKFPSLMRTAGAFWKGRAELFKTG